MRIALYARVSTKDKGQEVENQLAPLREYATRMNYEIVAEFKEQISASGKVARPAFESMMLQAYQRQFDLVLFWSLDRFSREGVHATFQHLQRLNEYQVKWKSYTEPFLDSTGPMGEAIIAIFACIAKQERVRIQERVKAGMDRAKELGTKSGKSIGRQKKIFRRDLAIEMRQAGKSIREIAKELGISPAIAHRELVGVPKPSPAVFAIHETLTHPSSIQGHV
jgi:DNA invertase Pin-like site-specific DNA recombinase